VIGPLLTPLLTAIYALTGVAIAAYWYSGEREAIPIGAVLVAVLAFLCWLLARHWVTRRPRTAVTLYELLGLLVSLVSAIIGGIAVVLTITFTGLAGTAEPQKTLITSLSAALTALLTGVFVSVKELDDAIGKMVAKEFKSRYWQSAGLKDSQIAEKRRRHPTLFEVPNLSPAITAVEAEWDSDWTDWSRDARRERAKVISQYVTWVGDHSDRRGRWSDEWDKDGIARPELNLQPAPLESEGWYSDPTEEAPYRWWNGSNWTVWTSPKRDAARPASAAPPIESAAP